MSSLPPTITEKCEQILQIVLTLNEDLAKIVIKDHTPVVLTLTLHTISTQLDHVMGIVAGTLKELRVLPHLKDGPAVKLLHQVGVIDDIVRTRIQILHNELNTIKENQND